MEQDFISQTALDQMVGSDYDQMMKAAIPYLPPRGQQVLSVYAKTKELINTVSLFSGAGEGVSMCATPPDAAPMEVIQDIRRFCYGKSRNTLDRMVNMMTVVQLMQLMNQSTENQTDVKKEEL